MAILQVNFLSKCLKRIVSFNAFIPLEKMDLPNMPEVKKPEKFKTIYLLHGYSGNCTDWLNGSRIQELAMMHNVAVIMPSGDNSFYLDNTATGEYGEYVGKELVEFTRQLFPLSDMREDTIIGGFSMGGYGAIRNGLKYSDTFGSIIALSSALITENIAGITEDFKDGIADYSYYNHTFGDLNKLLGSDNDPKALASKLIEEKKAVPDIYMACGSEDFLINENHDFRDHLTGIGIDFTYNEGPGVHNWAFWDNYIEKALNWVEQKSGDNYHQ